MADDIQVTNDNSLDGLTIPDDSGALAQGLAQPQGGVSRFQQVQQQADSLSNMGPAPSLSLSMPDNSAQQATEAVQQAEADNPAPLPRFQRTIGNTLRGMLMGLAQGGIPGMVGGGISPTGVQRNADQIQQSRQLSLQEQQAGVKFANAQAASMAADAMRKNLDLQHYDEEHQQRVFQNNQSNVDWLEKQGIFPTWVTNNDGQSEMAQMKAVGTVPPTLSLATAPGAIAHFDLTQVPGKTQLDAVNQLNSHLGRPQIDAQTWQKLGTQGQMQQFYSAMNYWTPDPSEQNLLLFKNELARVQSLPAGALQDKDATVQKLQTTISNMQSTLDQAQQRGLNQKLKEGKVEAQIAGEKAYATGYGSTAGSLKASQAAIKDANGNWNPASEPVSLVEGNMDPTQLSKRSKTYDATLQQANQYSLEKYGKPFDIAQAQMDYHYAQSPQTQNTLRMINGMTEPNGAISIAQNAAQSLPKTNLQTLNKIFNATATEFGSTQETNFHTAMLGLADEYSKVMGGGVSSDTGRQQALDILKAAYSKGQLTGAIQTMQSDLNARKTALIGNNRYLMRQFSGQPSPPPSGGGGQQQQFQKFSSDGKWGWNGQQWVATGR